MGSSESTTTFTAGQMHVQLQNNVVSFSAGQTISGWVHVNLQGPMYETDSLTLTLYGNERVYF